MILEERARLCEKLYRPGESGFPFTHQRYPYQQWATPERLGHLDGMHVEAPADPFAKSPGGSGLAVWDVAATPSPYTEIAQMSPSKVPAFRKTNTTWLEKTMQSFYAVGMSSGDGIRRRPKDDAIVDLVSEKWGWRLLEAAHALAHREELQPKFRPAGYGAYGSRTIHWVAKLAVAIKYGIPVDMYPWAPRSSDDNDGFSRYGISVCDTNGFHAPALRVPCIGNRAPVPDKDIAFVVTGVYIEPHPKGFTDGTSGWLEVNRWSCSPTMVSIAGWECVDTVFRQMPVSLNGSTPEFVVAAPALMPHDTFGEFIASAIAARGEAKPDNSRYWRVLDWLGSKSCDAVVASSPPLPCRECMRMNMRAYGAPGRPDCPMPTEKPDPKAKFHTYEDRMWMEWDAKIDSVFDIVEKAVMYHEARMYGATSAKRMRRARRKASNDRLRTLSRIATLDKKILREMRNGRPSVAEAALAEKQLLQAGLRDAILSANAEEKEA